MLDPEIKRKWVEALRSGKYKQGKNYLAAQQDPASEIHYCCLGVLCEVLQLPNSREPGYDSVLAYSADEHKVESSTTAIPCTAAKRIGLELVNPVIAGEHAQYRNDVLGHSFLEIADAIESDPNL